MDDEADADSVSTSQGSGQGQDSTSRSRYLVVRYHSGQPGPASDGLENAQPDVDAEILKLKDQYEKQIATLEKEKEAVDLLGKPELGLKFDMVQAQIEQIDELKRGATSLRNSMEEKDQIIARLLEEKKISETQTSKSKSDGLMRDIEILQKKEADYQDRIADLNTKVSNKHVKMKEAYKFLEHQHLLAYKERQSNQQLRDQIESNGFQIQDVRFRLEAKEDELQTTKARLDSKTNELREIKGVLQTSRDERTTKLQQELDASRAKIEDLTLQLETKNKDLQKCKDDLNERNNEIQSVTTLHMRIWGQVSPPRYIASLTRALAVVAAFKLRVAAEETDKNYYPLTLEPTFGPSPTTSCSVKHILLPITAPHTIN